jgi:hypothetical protein
VHRHIQRSAMNIAITLIAVMLALQAASPPWSSA